MKRFLNGALTIAIAAIAWLPTKAQQPQLPQLPMDSAIIYGKLPNGLTYYIRHNEYPKGQADFHIAQKVGSILEEDNQRGLAHFLEHMCFNGTKNFPGNSLISYLESVGVKFGNHLNAYTGTDETVYKITNVPTARTEVTDSVMLILHDWANELLLDPQEIDKERGVIHEEWRSSNVGQMRILEQLLPTIYPGSRYGHRLPIGTMEVVDNFPYQVLRDYYEAWYRPDLQGIIISGDIDPVRTEQKLKQMFSDIEMPANAPARIEFPVPSTPGTIFAIGADKEMTNSIVYLMFKHEPLEKELRNTPAYYTVKYVEAMITSMLNERFQEMMSKPDTPFAFAAADIENYMLSNTEEMFDVVAAAKDGDIATTLKTIYREVLRAKRGGFTHGEYDRARAEYLASVERAFNNRTTVENGTYTEEMIRSFIDGTPLPGIDIEYQLIKQMAPLVSLDIINSTFDQMVSDDNRVVLCMLPDNVQLPSEQFLADMMKSVDAEEIEAFTDTMRDDPLIPALPSPGSVISTSPAGSFQATEEWTLSNGAKVYVKKTPFKNDEIIMIAAAPGGMSRVYTTASPADALVLDLFEDNFGIGSYTNADLQKYLAGKKVGINPSFGLYQSQVSGSSTPKDLPTLLELVYGYFTSVNYSDDEFEATRSLYYGLLQNQEANPQFIFRRDLNKSLFSSPYQQAMTAADIKACTRQGVQSLIESRVNDASQWSFVFVGNVDTDALRTLCEQYIATLPSTASPMQRVLTADPAYEVKAGTGTDTYTTKMETPQTYCAVVETASVPFTSFNAKMSTIVGQILNARLLKNIREEMGAVYSIGAYGDIDPQEGRNMSVISTFPMNPDKKAEVLEAIATEFKAMAEEITPDELAKVKEYLVKTYGERAEENDSWASYISQWVLSGKDLFTNAIPEVNSITPADVRNFVKEMNAQGNYRVVILDPQP